MNVTVGYTPEKEKEKGDRKSRLASSVLVDQVATLNQDGQEDCRPPGVLAMAVVILRVEICPSPLLKLQNMSF